MTDPPYHLLLEADEIPVAASAMRLFISDEAHQPQIRRIARAVLDELQAQPDERGRLMLELSPPQMKLLHSATHLLLDDSRREQAEERDVLHAILRKLPDEHTMRAIQID
jgi:hypothetical protein